MLLSSHSDMHERTSLNYWQFAQQIAGDELRYFIVTEGEQGARLYSAEGETRISAVTAAVVDTTGAGDVYAAGLIHGLLSGLEITAAMGEAAVWGAYAVASETLYPASPCGNICRMPAADVTKTLYRRHAVVMLSQ
ncbi:MAG: PfkB family carbohydrate kinase [Shewanella fodinae]|nr:PfkB family carbohydrate kinase [Shewanella fodinae]